MKVKVRIALAIDAKGTWCAYGCNSGKVNQVTHDKEMFDGVLDAVEDGERRYIIEAEVEQPDEALPVVVGSANEVQS